MAFFGAKPKKAAAPMTTPEPTKTNTPLFEEAPAKATPLFSEAPTLSAGPFQPVGPLKGVVDFSQSNVTFDMADSLATLIVLGESRIVNSTSNGIEPLTPGQNILLLESEDVTDTDIELFLGLAEDTLDSLTNREPTNGAVLQFSFGDGNKSQVVKFDWNFASNESGNTFDDFAFYATSDGQVGVLSRSTEVESQDGVSGWQVGELTINPTDEPMFIAFGVMNVEDTGVNAFLGLGDVELLGVSTGVASGSPFFG